MGKVKTFAALFAVTAFLFAGAYFPKIISVILDWSNTGITSYRPLGTIQLDIKKNISSVGRLAMMSRATGSIELPLDKAQMTPNDVLEAIHKALQPYIDTQLITYAEFDVQMYPHLVQVPGIPELQGIVWLVAISGDPDNFTYLDLAIDDETGHILSIAYTSEMPNATLSETNVLCVFSELFFSGLGIDNYQQFLSSDLDYAYVGDQADAVRYILVDMQYGAVPVDFHVYKCGFYVDFSNQ